MMWRRIATGAALAAAAQLVLGCTLPQAARRSSERLKRGWSVDAHGAHILWTGPASTLVAAGELAVYSVVSPDGPELEPQVKWFRHYDAPMRSVEDVAILCHLDRSTHIATIRPVRDPIPAEARHEAWHFPECIETLEGQYELTVGYYSRKTVNENLQARTTTTESTKLSTTHWDARAGQIYLLAAVVGKPVRAPGDAPQYRVRPRTRELWNYDYKLEVSHWKAAIVELGSRDALQGAIVAHRDSWRRHEKSR
jgi:hypothetical protein